MTTDEDALFGVTEARPARPGAVLAAFRATVARAQTEGTLSPVDEALIESAAVLAEAMDTARRIGGPKGGYLAAQTHPAFQKALHALRLPVELTAATPPAPAGNGADRPTGTPDWFRDAFGAAE